MAAVCGPLNDGRTLRQLGAHRAIYRVNSRRGIQLLKGAEPDQLLLPERRGAEYRTILHAEVASCTAAFSAPSRLSGVVFAADVPRGRRVRR